MTLADKVEKLQRGEELESIGNFIAHKNAAVCTVTSLTAHKHFSRNDDGHGLERGDLTYAIAYAERNTDSHFRFTDKEQDILVKQYQRFLKPLNVILFNDNFFNAEIEELRELAKVLNIV